MGAGAEKGDKHIVKTILKENLHYFLLIHEEETDTEKQ